MISHEKHGKNSSTLLEAKDIKHACVLLCVRSCSDALKFNLAETFITGDLGLSSGRKEDKMSKHVYGHCWRIRLVSAILSFAMTGSLMLGAVRGGPRVNAAEAPSVSENFEDCESVADLKGGMFGSPTFELSEDNGVEGSKALIVKNRVNTYDAYSIDLAEFIGNTISVKADVKTIGTEEAVEVKASIKLSENDYPLIQAVSAASDAFTGIDSTYKIPADAEVAYIYFEAPENVDYVIDNISITVEGEYIDPSTIVIPKDPQVGAPEIVEDFNDYEDASSKKGSSFGTPTFALTDEGVDGSKALVVGGRTESYFGYSFDVAKFIGNTISVKADVKPVEAADAVQINATIKLSTPGVDDAYTQIGTVAASSDAFASIDCTYEISADHSGAVLYFEAPKDVEYVIDNISITVVGEYKDPTAVTPGDGTAPEFIEDFNDYEDASSKKGSSFGTPTFALTDEGVDGSKALVVGGRTESYFGYSFDVAKFIGNTISVKADVKPVEAADAVQINATIKLSTPGVDDAYTQIGTVAASSDAFASIDCTYEISADHSGAVLYFEAPKDVEYVIDNISITVVGEYKDPNGGSEGGYVDTSGYPVLKDLYNGKFLMGVACETITNFQNSNCEIGNEAKENLIKQQFDSITFGNELKPAYNMDVTNKSGERTDTFLPFVINPSAKEMLDFAKDNGLKVRAHVLVWHSQNADEMFYVDYDTSKGYASKDVVKARMTSYIDNTIKYMYENGYADVIYAWDVVNEAVEPGTNADNLRDSLYYQILGKDFLMYAFKQARESVNKYSNDFGGSKPALFYNDYNEFQKEKCDAIIELLTPVKEAGYIDGIGMQAHVSDGTNINDFITAMKRYDEAFGQVQITELDVTTTGTGVNAEYYQGKFYYDLFKALIEARDEGVNLTSVTIWGLTDDNSWKKESSPLIFNKDLSRKKSFNGIVAAATGEDIGEPEYVKPDYSDIRVNFDDETLPSVFSVRGDGSLTVQSDVVCEGKYALLDSGRTATWNGASFNVSKFAGQTIGISAWVKSDAPMVKISADIDGKWPNITTADTSSGEWVQIIGEYKIPAELKALNLYFETEDLSDIYIDALRVKAVGKDEGFEDAENIASSRGVGHMPVLTVSETVAKSGSQSLRVTRQEQDANVSFDVSDYIGQYITASVYVKTDDSNITLGIDGDTPVPCAKTASSGDWTKITATFAIPAGGVSAKLYVETDGNADMYLDDFSVRYAEFAEDVEGESNIFGTRWGGAGKLSVVEDETGNAVVLSENDQTYYGITFDASAYIGNEIDVQFDAKTNDETVKLSGDIDSVWPNYLSTPATAGKYKSVGTTIRVPSEYNALKMYVETSGTSDLYLDNFSIKRIPVGPEAKVTFDLSAFEMENVTVLDRIGYRIPAETFELPEGKEITGWYKDAACTERFDFGTEILNGDITLYATDGTAIPTTEPPKTEDPSTLDPGTQNPSAVDPNKENPSNAGLKEYKILNGADPKYTLGSKTNIVIRSEGPIENYKSISFGDKKVPDMALKVTKGSTIIEIDSLYLESLKPGEYNVHIEFTDGYSNTKLTIVEGSENTIVEAANSNANSEKGALVKTGDVGAPIEIIAILMVALGGVFTVSVIRKRKDLE